MSLPAAKTLRRAPSAAWFMLRALLPKTRGGGPQSPALRLAPMRPDSRDLDNYHRLTGQRASAALSIVWPQVWGFRLQMALLTDRAFPLPIWSALQVRNRLLQHAPVAADARYARAVRARPARRVDKGVEVDLHSTLHDEQGALAWESLTTFYWRGGAGAAPADAPSPRAESPQIDADILARWPSGVGSGWRFGALTGDYNGLHSSDAYARALGFARAFHHPPRVAAQCLEHLGVDTAAPCQRLDLWIKGPVFYGAELALRVQRGAQACTFALQVDADPRPALVGQWSIAAADAALP